MSFRAAKQRTMRLGLIIPIALLLTAASFGDITPREPREPRTPRPVASVRGEARELGTEASPERERPSSSPRSSTPSPTPPPSPRPQTVPDRIRAAWPGNNPEAAVSVARCETAGTFDPTIYNFAGSGANGLFQFKNGTYARVGGNPPAANDSVEEQTRRAWELYQQSGWSEWAAVCRP